MIFSWTFRSEVFISLNFDILLFVSTRSITTTNINLIYIAIFYFVDPGVEKVRFVKDLSAWWYKPHATRDEGKIIIRFY